MAKQAKAIEKKPPSHARRPSTRAKAAKNVVSDSETAAVKPKKAPKKDHGKKLAEAAESGSNEGEDDGDEVKCVLCPSYPFRILTDLHSWKDVSLNWSLISALEENETIKQVLFPMPGEKATLNVAGKPKTEQQYRLAEILFKDHEKYGAAFSKVTTPVDKAAWTLKVKNCLTRYVWS
jgi:hypothetical protein